MAFAEGFQAGANARLRKQELALQQRQQITTEFSQRADETSQANLELARLATEIIKSGRGATPQGKAIIDRLRSTLRDNALTLAQRRRNTFGGNDDTVRSEVERALMTFDGAVAGVLSPQDQATSEAQAEVSGVQATARALTEAGTPTSDRQAAQAKGLLPEREFQSKSGKLLADRDLAAEVFGEDSQQVRILDSALDSEQNPDADIDDNLKVFKEFSRQSKEFVTAAAGLQKVVNAANDNTGASDVALIFGFFKTIDPQSTIREGEFATAESVGSANERFVGLFNRIKRGERLTPIQRQEFVQAAASQFLAVADQQEVRRGVFENLAAGLNLDAGLLVQSAVPEGLVDSARELAGQTFDAASGPLLTPEDEAVLSKPLLEITVDEAKALSPAGKEELRRLLRESVSGQP